MNLQLAGYGPYTFLESGILIVEPHEGRLAARAMLLQAADYYVGIRGTSSSIPRSRQPGDEVAIAILSESLGHAVLCATAHVVRERWPRARILIFGRQGEAIPDSLHDARMDHRAPPENLLAALVSLLEEFAKESRSAMSCGRCTLTLPTESDPTKRHFQRGTESFPSDLAPPQQCFRRAS